MDHEVIFHPAALAELEDLYDVIASRSSPSTARGFVTGLTDYCTDLSTFPKRGTERREVMPGIRIVGYRRVVSIVFTVETNKVLIIGIFYSGRNITMDLLEKRT